MDNSAKKITNIKKSTNTHYVDKYVTRTTNEKNSVLFYTAVKASTKYTVGVFFNKVMNYGFNNLIGITK